MKFFAFFFCTIFSISAFSQVSDTLSTTLTAVEVKAYGGVRKLKDMPAAVGYVNTQTLTRFSPSSIVQAINTVPGVRMEERSPGSYRFNIRGSSLRSPFGVRNVKVYYNDIPFTDPGGNTYLNSLGYYNFSSVEILKGPGSSLYGAGTGGVLLIESLNPSQSANATGTYTTGSYGLQNVYVSLATGETELQNKFDFQHQQSDGYRNHSALRRDVFSWTGNFRFTEKQRLKTTILYSDLFYQTPGALTEAEYKRDPKASRPGGGGFPSAAQNRAAIHQKTFLAGLSFNQNLTASITNASVAYGAFTELRNPAIRNYGKEVLPHVGGRTVFSGRKKWMDAVLDLSFGGELQQSFATSTVYNNKAGLADSLRTADDIRVRQAFVFLQANLTFKAWEITTGTSFNNSGLQFQRLAPAPFPQQSRTLNNQLAPRLAIARRFTTFTVYSSVSKGFSPPTSTELLPTGSNINLSLQSEEGTNYDIGFRSLFFGKLSIDMNAFYFRLKNTIVQRRDAGGGEYFINAGRTAQKGIETGLNYSFPTGLLFMHKANLWLNHAFHFFRYKDFKQASTDYSGNALPGVAPHTISSGFEWSTQVGLLGNFTYYFNDQNPLNDANSAYAEPFHLLGLKLGYKKEGGKKFHWQLSAGVENILDQNYSLGNDVNGFGGRYFNAAPGRNYYTSLTLQPAGK